MYHNTAFDKSFFIYFWIGQDKAINNDRPSRLFDNPFYVPEDNQTGWRKSSRPDMIAPELLTYWEI